MAPAVAAEIPRIAEAVDRIVGAGARRRTAVLHRRWNQRPAGCSGRRRMSADVSSARRSWCKGIIAGGEAALARATEASEDDPEADGAILPSRGFTGKDALVGIAASGRTPYVLGAVDAANKLGALTVGISCTPDSPLAQRVQIAITPLVGPEVIAGSTRMKAGTATKLVLNMISTAVMIRLGYVFGNLMVNVQPRNTQAA